MGTNDSCVRLVPTRSVCDRLRESYDEVIHPCGLTVLVSHKELSTYHAVLGVRYGASDRPAAFSLPRGVAHFLEHKMFERAKGSYDDDFGALGADINAYTTYDRTAYMFSCTRHFSEALRLLLTMSRELTVSSRSVARERDIIAEEIRMNADDPWERCYAELLRALYVRHPVREEICGSENSIRRITPRLLALTHETFYRPDNMVLAVSGRTDLSEVLAVVDEIFGTTPWTEDNLPVLREVNEPSKIASARVVRRMDTAKPLFAIGVKHPTPPEGARALLRCDLAMSVLSEMLFSHAGDFYSDLFERGVVSPGMSYSTAIGDGYACFSVSGECDDPDEVLAAFHAYIERLHAEGLSRADFERVRRVLYAAYVSGFDSVEDIASSLLDYALDSLHEVERIGVYDYLSVVEALTIEDVEKMFREVFCPERVALSVILPLA